MNKEQLLARAQELQIEVPDGAKNVEIENLIKVAEHPTLAAAVKDLDATKKELEAALIAANEANADLKDLLEAKAEADKPGTHATFKDGKDKYAFGIKAFRFKGEKYEATEAVKDKDLMAQIIESKFIHLKKL